MKRMPDWSPSKLVDNLWDEFDQTDVLIMPYQGGETVNESVAVSDADRHVENNAGESTDSRGLTKAILWRKEKPYLVSPMNCESCDPSNANMLVSQDAEVFDCCIKDCNANPASNIFCTGNSILGTKGSTDESNDCHFSLDNVSPAVKNTCLLENGHEDRENDLAYYDWPDIGNFEDIDKMFRNCDVTFGQGCTDNANELSWFRSSSHSIYGSEITFDSGFQSSCSELSVLNNALEYQSANTNFLPQIDSPSAVNDKSSTVGYQFHGSWFDASAGIKDEFASKELSDKRAETKLPALNQTCRGSEDVDMITDIGSQYSSEEKIIHQFADRKHFLQSASSSHVHTFNCHSELEYSLPTHEVPFSQGTLSNAFENDTDLSSSHRVLAQVVTDSYQNMKRLPNESSLPPIMTPEEKMEKYKLKLGGSVTVDHMHQQTSCTSKTMVLKNHQKSQCEAECSSEQEERSLRLSAIRKDSTITQNSFMTTASSDDISLEETSFQQLWDVIDQLDIRTKLCIRDSLYRLARSSRQRHIFSNTSSCNKESQVARGSRSTETSNKCAETNCETETNPIDRSIAHLLFHKPSDPSTGCADDA